MMTMMVVSLLDPDDSDDMNRALMLTLALVYNDLSSLRLESMVSDIKRHKNNPLPSSFFRFIDESDGGVVLRSLEIGADKKWDWYEPDCCTIEKDM